MSARTLLPQRIFRLLGDAAAATESSDHGIQILQFNTLADTLSNDFPHVSADFLSWKHREGLLHEALTEHNFDFICAEEVDHFSDSFEPFLGDRGYSGIFAMRRVIADGDTTASRDGAALFWKRDKFSILAQATVKHASKTVGVVATFARISSDGQPTSEPRLIVAAIHLTAKPGQEAVRCKEAAELVRVIDSFNKDGEDRLTTIIGGDFNDVPDSEVCDFVRSHGFLSAYEHDERAWTTWKKRQSEVKRVIDYIWYRPGSSANLRPVAVLEVPADEVFPHMLPAADYPSDHLAIGAQFREFI